MVVKPTSFIANGRKGLVQPGIKCRGREYLRIIYGPEYAEPRKTNPHIRVSCRLICLKRDEDQNCRGTDSRAYCSVKGQTAATRTRSRQATVPRSRVRNAPTNASSTDRQ